MKKQYRILKNKEFSKIISKGKCVSNKFLSIYYIKKSNNWARIGISISKKNGNAVKRNKIKRQLKHIIKDHINFWEWKYDLIIFSKRDYNTNIFEKSKNVFQKLTEKITQRKGKNK